MSKARKIPVEYSGQDGAYHAGYLKGYSRGYMAGIRRGIKDERARKPSKWLQALAIIRGK